VWVAEGASLDWPRTSPLRGLLASTRIQDLILAKLFSSNNKLPMARSILFVLWLSCCSLLQIPTLTLAETRVSSLPKGGGAWTERSSSRQRFRKILSFRGGDDYDAYQEDDATTTISGASTVADDFTLLSDTVLHDHWRRLINRRVRLPSGLVADFEIVGQRGTDEAVLVFCWNTHRKTATLVSEYMPATHNRQLGLAAGMVEAHKHGSNEDANDDNDSMQLTAAQHELEEECRLTGGQWIRLTGDRPVTMDKYSTTRLSVFLVLDPVPVTDGNHKQRDELEEGMEVVENVSVDDLRRMMKDAQLTVVGSWASLLALDRLREIGEVE